MSFERESDIIIVFARMKHEIPIRIRVNQPPPGIVTRVQRGKDELLPASTVEDGSMTFDFPITVDMTESVPNFLGKYAQGPKTERFVYVNSGSYAGAHSVSGRRAKISLMTITRKQIEQVINGGGILFTEYNGTGRDGGPTCASVKGIEWKVVAK